MGRKGQPHEEQPEYSLERSREAEDALKVSRDVVEREYERSGHRFDPDRYVARSSAEQSVGRVKYALQCLGDALGVSNLSQAWKGFDEANHRLEEMKAAGEDEARALNEEYEKLKKEAGRSLEESLRKLADFEQEKLQIRGSADTPQETSEDTTVN